MSDELRVQRREKCTNPDGLNCTNAPDPFRGLGASYHPCSDECQGDGTRWVTVGTLRHGRNSKYAFEGAYIAGTFCGFVDDESDLYGRCADGFYEPLYVIEPTTQEEAP